MSRWPLLRLAFRRRRRMLTSIALGMFVFEGVISAAAATIDISAIAEGLPKVFESLSASGGVVELASVQGLLGSGLAHPFWIAMQTTVVSSLGAAVLAADVEGGTIELIATRPVPRRRIVGERIAALVLALVGLDVIAFVSLLGGWLLMSQLRDAVTVAGLAAASLTGLSLGLCLAGPVVLMSAHGRRQGQVVAVGAGLAAVGVVINFLAVAWSPMGWSRYASPFYYYRPGLALVTATVSLRDMAVLLSVFVIGAVGALVVVGRRDLV